MDYNPIVGAGHLHRSLAIALSFRRNYQVEILVRGKRISNKLLDKNFRGAVHFLTDDKQIDRFIKTSNSRIVFFDLYKPSSINRFTKNANQIWFSLEDWNKVERKDVGIVNPNLFAGSLHNLKSDRMLLGPDYYPLNQELIKFKPNGVLKNRVQTVLITFGGNDKNGLTEKVLKCLKEIAPSLKIVIILGTLNDKSRILKLTQNGSRHVSCFTDLLPRRVFRMMKSADLTITAGGATAYESSYFGTPCVILAQNSLQAKTGKFWGGRKAAFYLGEGNLIEEGKIKRSLSKILNNTAARTRVFENAKKMIDGKGVQRIFKYVMEKEQKIADPKNK